MRCPKKKKTVRIGNLPPTQRCEILDAAGQTVARGTAWFRDATETSLCLWLTGEFPEAELLGATHVRLVPSLTLAVTLVTRAHTWQVGTPPRYFCDVVRS